MIYYNAVLFGVFVAVVGLGYAYFLLTRGARDAAPQDKMCLRREG